MRRRRFARSGGTGAGRAGGRGNAEDEETLDDPARAERLVAPRRRISNRRRGRPGAPAGSTTAIWWPRAKRVVVINQHALHERILYEQRRGSVPAARWSRSACWCREPVDLGPAEAAPCGKPGRTGSAGSQGRAVWRRNGVCRRLSGDAGQHSAGRGAARPGRSAAGRRPRPSRATCWTSFCTR